jgi:hypothetical protein
LLKLGLQGKEVRLPEVHVKTGLDSLNELDDGSVIRNGLCNKEITRMSIRIGEGVGDECGEAATYWSRASAKTQ